MEKVLIYLLGRKAIYIKKLKQGYKEETKAKEISETLNLSDSSVRKYLSVDLKGIVRSKKGSYDIPNFNLFKCEEVFKKDDEVKGDKTKRSN